MTDILTVVVGIIGSLAAVFVIAALFVYVLDLLMGVETK